MIEGSVGHARHARLRQRSVDPARDRPPGLAEPVRAAGCALSDVSTVVSFPHTLAQCRGWLPKLPGAQGVALDVRRGPRGLEVEATEMAAICNSLAADLYGLEVLASDVEDHPENQTRFVLVGRGVPAPTGHDKTSIVCFQREDQPGSLLSILQEFAARDDQPDEAGVAADQARARRLLLLRRLRRPRLRRGRRRRAAQPRGEAGRGQVPRLLSRRRPGRAPRRRRRRGPGVEERGGWVESLREQIREPSDRPEAAPRRARIPPGIERKRVRDGLDRRRARDRRRAPIARARRSRASAPAERGEQGDRQGRARPSGPRRSRPRVGAEGRAHRRRRRLAEAVAARPARARAAGAQPGRRLGARRRRGRRRGRPRRGRHAGRARSTTPPSRRRWASSTPRTPEASGSRFAYIMRRGRAARARARQLRDEHDRRHGFVPVITPTLVRERTMEEAGFFPTDRAQVYDVDDGELFLLGTSEVALSALHRAETFTTEAAARHVTAVSPRAFGARRAPTARTRGIFRVHQFDKVEMFSFCAPESGVDEHERILAIEEEVVGGLGLPYRVVNIAAADLGPAAAKKFDIEAWLPSEGAYREDHVVFELHRLLGAPAGDPGEARRRRPRLVHTSERHGGRGQSHAGVPLRALPAARRQLRGPRSAAALYRLRPPSPRAEGHAR